jgi:Protein of unknown function (DUF3078)
LYPKICKIKKKIPTFDFKQHNTQSMKRIILSVVFCIIVQGLWAQTDATPTDTTYWKTTIQTGINFNQANFSPNWKAGGVNSLALGAFLNAKADYLKGNLTFNNDLQLQYGIVKNAGQDQRKTADRIFFDSKVGYVFNPKWNLFYSLNFVSQFDVGYAYEKDASGIEKARYVSRFLAPAFLTQSLGIEYKPFSYFTLRFSPATYRNTFVTDKDLYKTEAGNYGVTVGETIRHEIAAQFIANFDKDIAPNLNLKARWMIFTNYQTPLATDTRLDLNLTAKINKWINVNLAGVIFYDQDMDTQIQYSQTLALGVLYTLAR